MTHRAFCEDLTSDTVVIGDSEAHHLLHVLRLSVRSQLTVFNGQGTEADVVVVSATRRDVTCKILARRTYPRRESGGLTVFASPPKADRLKWMIEKLTEIGVDRLVLLNTQRTVVTPGDTRVEKLKANVFAACKQCRRPWLMEILPLRTFSSCIEDLILQPVSQTSFIAHPGIEFNSQHLLSLRRKNSINLLIGPEGGFTEDEVKMAFAAGIQPIAWPDTILRIETATVVFSTLLMHHQACIPASETSEAGEGSATGS